MLKKLISILPLVFIVFVSGCTTQYEYGTTTTTMMTTTTTPQMTTTTLATTTTQPGQPEVKEFTVTAKQWEFIPSTITVSEGDTVRLMITSIDVTHGFAIPQFGVNEVLNSGQTVIVEFVADEAGSYSFYCTVYCGAGHSQMRGTLIVQ